MKDPSTRDKSKIAQKPEQISLPLFSSLRPFYRGYCSCQPLPHLAGICFYRLIVAVPEGILLVKNSRSKRIVAESGEGLWRKRTYFLVKHGVLSSRNFSLCRVFP